MALAVFVSQEQLNVKIPVFKIIEKLDFLA